MQFKQAVPACLIALALSAFAPPAQAYSITQIPGVPVTGDFVLDQGKTEVALAPGEKSQSQISVTNRSENPIVFRVSVEDFTGSKSSEQNLVFMGEQRSPYSLKDYLKPEISQFTLAHGEKITLPVAINIPSNASPGGLYGAVIITAQPSTAAQAGSNIQVVSRLASLFFVRIKGEAQVGGGLKSFSIARTVSDRPEVDFSLLYENTGNIFIAPSGRIAITNLIGRSVGQIDIPGFYVMPDSVRQLKMKFKNDFMFGYYRAELRLDRGYGNQADKQSIGFWILPWKLTLALLAALALAVWIVDRIIKSFRR